MATQEKHITKGSSVDSESLAEEKCLEHDVYQSVTFLLSRIMPYSSIFMKSLVSAKPQGEMDISLCWTDGCQTPCVRVC